MTHHFIFKFVKSISLLLLILIAFPSFSADIDAGKAKAASCIGCHGPQGIAFAPNFPNLAGQKEFYLIAAINSYKNGTRNDPTMKAMVAALSETDVANLSAYFASLPRK